jgi:hypothetical protein
MSLTVVSTLATVAVVLSVTSALAADKSGSIGKVSAESEIYASDKIDSVEVPEEPDLASPFLSGTHGIGNSSPIRLAASAAPATSGATTGSTGLPPGFIWHSTAEPNSSAEIPQASPSVSASGTGPAPATSATSQSGPVDFDDGAISYEQAKEPEMNGPPIGSLDDFMSDGDFTSPLGIEVREDKRRLKGGEEADGLLIVDVFAGSPAAHAGLRSYHRAMRDALETAAVAGAMFCPPVVLLVPVFDQVRLGESFDLIIGVDGSRVTNFLDFQDRLRDVQPGEIVYLSIIRNGKRAQIPVPVPANLANPPF